MKRGYGAAKNLIIVKTIVFELVDFGNKGNKIIYDLYVCLICKPSSNINL